MNLTPHFTIEELTATDVRGVENRPPDDVIPRLGLLAEHILEPVRKRFGPVIIHSGYRSPALNERIGGSKTSQHMRGEAADFHVIGVDFFTVARWIVATLEFDQLILEFCDRSGFGKGWVHCSYTHERNNRKLITVASNAGGLTQYRNIEAQEIPIAA